MKPKPQNNAEKLAKLCRSVAREKKAEDAVILNLRGVSTVADYFVICSGNSEPHLKAIADEIGRQLRDQGIRSRGLDGNPASRWIVMDYGDVMIHIFHPDLRERYGLEQLWGDAKRVR